MKSGKAQAFIDTINAAIAAVIHDDKCVVCDNDDKLHHYACPIPHMRQASADSEEAVMDYMDEQGKFDDEE